MYLSFYNLKVKPFQMSTDPEFLWLGEKHREALAILKYAILENKGVLALTGDVGTGKTTLINALLRSLGEDTVTATIYDPRLEVLDFFNTVAAAFKMGESFEGKGKFILKFRDFLARVHKQNKSVLLIIDEAQGINEDLLEEIRLLSNLEAGYARLLNIFFVGQNEFIDILQKYENRALRQRVSIRYHIDPLTLNETAAYIKYRLEVGGTKALIFDSGAIDEVFIFSDGYPRLINIMCDHALLSGYVREFQVINADLIRECREELLVSKKNSQKDFEYFRDVHQPLQHDTRVIDPPVDPFIPVEDHHIQEDEQMAFSLSQPMIEPIRPRKPKKKGFLRSPIFMGFILIVGVASGFIFYNNDNNNAESFVTLAKKQAKKYVSTKTGSNNDKPPMVQVRSETSDSPSRVEAGKVGDSRFFDEMPPNSTLRKETISKESETSQVIPSKQFPEDNGVQTYTTKPVDTVPSNLRQKGPVIVPVTEKTPETIKTKAVKPDEKPETVKSITKPVQVKKKTSQKYQTKPEVKKKTEPKSPKKPAMEKRSPVASSVSSEKKAITLAAVPVVRQPNKTVVSKTDQPMMNKTEATKKTQQTISSADEKKAGSRDDKNIVPSIDMMRKLEKENKVIFYYNDIETRLKNFLIRYCWSYAQKDLDQFSTFFTPNALENGMPFRHWHSQYRKNFNRMDSIEYDIELERYAIQEETGLVKVDGVFHVRAKLVDSKKWRKKSGQISMILESDENSFKVRQLDY